MPEFPRKSPSPPSCQEAALTRFREAIPEGSSQELITEELIKLKNELIHIRDFDRYDRHSLFPVTKKENYRTIDIIEEQKHAICSIHALPDGSIISGGLENSIRIWTKTPFNKWESCVLSGHTGTVSCVQGLPGNKILSGGADGTIRLWTRDSSGEWQNETIHELSETVTCLQAFPSGAIIAADLGGRLLFGGQSPDGQWHFLEIGEHGTTVNCIHGISEHSFFSGSNNGSLRFWQKSPSGEWTNQKMEGHNGRVHGIQVLSNEQALSSGADRTIRFWSRNGEKQWQSTETISETYETPVCVQALLDGRVVSGGISGHVFIWHKTTDDHWEVECLAGHHDYVSSLQVLRSGEIVSGSWDNTIRIWDGEEVE